MELLTELITYQYVFWMFLEKHGHMKIEGQNLLLWIWTAQSKLFVLWLWYAKNDIHRTSYIWYHCVHFFSKIFIYIACVGYFLFNDDVATWWSSCDDVMITRCHIPSSQLFVGQPDQDRPIFSTWFISNFVDILFIKFFRRGAGQFWWQLMTHCSMHAPCSWLE